MEKIKNLIKKYTDIDFNISVSSGDNHFIHQTAIISPLNNKKVIINVAINDENNISIVDSNIVSLKSFNIAEGYSQDDMAMGIASLLANDYQIGRKTILVKRRATLQLGNKKIYGLIRK